MSKQHIPNWVEASMMLRDAMERYRDKEQKASLSKVIDELIFYIQENIGKWLDVKTIRRDIGNKRESKKLYPIPNWRVEIYAKWFYETTCEDREWIARWIEKTAYPSPGKLLTEVFDGDIQEVYTTVKSNVPPMNLWGDFLGRQEEIGKLQRWADHRRHPIAVLCGFGGNGKTTIQRKVGKEFVHGITCLLRWPYDGAVWVSALDYPRGQPNLCDVLREVARTFGLFDKELNLELIQPTVIKQEARELLEEKRVLVLLDNFETVSNTNQIEILEFFNDLEGASQTLISTRYRPDWFLEREQDEMYSMAHALIRVNGLSPEDAETLVQDFINTKSVPQDSFKQQEIKRLIEATHNNPKSILAVLGLVEQGMSLSYLLDAIVAGKPEADCIFDKIIDEAWEHILTEYDKAVLMAKAFFSHSVSETDLGQVAGVSGEHLTKAIKKLAAISFFEFEPTSEGARRIRTHPLAQDFARRLLRDHSEFESEAEERWWKEYGQNIIQKTIPVAYESINSALEEDIINLLEHLEKHLHNQSAYSSKAVNMFAEHRGLGSILRHWGYWDEVLRVAKIVLNFGIEHQNPRLIGMCIFRLITRIFSERGEFDETDKYISLAIEQNAKLNDRWLGAIIKIARADVYRRRGYFEAAKQSYNKALQVFSDLRDISYIAYTYFWLGAVTIEIATRDLEEAVDISGKTNEALAEAEKYHNESARYWAKESMGKVTPRYELVSQSLPIGIINRIRGELSKAQDLFQSCIGKLLSLPYIAQLYQELALVEHLLGNKELAYFYEEKGLTLFRQLGFIDTHTPHHCYRVIDRMKREGTW